MKFFLAFITFMSLMLSCSEKTEDINLVKGDLTTITVSVYYQETLYGGTVVDSADKSAVVYLFQGVNYRDDSSNAVYDYVGNGVLKHKTNGTTVLYTKKEIANNLGVVEFKNIPIGTHTIAAESANMKSKKTWTAINNKNSNTLELKFK